MDSKQIEELFALLDEVDFDVEARVMAKLQFEGTVPWYQRLVPTLPQLLPLGALCLALLWVVLPSRETGTSALGKVVASARVIGTVTCENAQVQLAHFNWREGQVVRTGEESRAIVRFDAGGRGVVGPCSEASIEDGTARVVAGMSLWCFDESSGQIVTPHGIIRCTGCCLVGVNPVWSEVKLLSGQGEWIFGGGEPQVMQVGALVRSGTGSASSSVTQGSLAVLDSATLLAWLSDMGMTRERAKDAAHGLLPKDAADGFTTGSEAASGPTNKNGNGAAALDSVLDK